MEKRLSPDHLVYAGTRNSKSKALSLGMGYALEGRCSGLSSLQPKTTHLDWSQAPLTGAPKKQLCPRASARAALMGPLSPPPFLLSQGRRWAEPNRHPALCKLQKWEKRMVFDLDRKPWEVHQAYYPFSFLPTGFDPLICQSRNHMDLLHFTLFSRNLLLSGVGV